LDIREDEGIKVKNETYPLSHEKIKEYTHFIRSRSHFEDFEEIFCYLLDTYLLIRTKGKIEIPLFSPEQEQKETINLLLDSGVALMEEGYDPVLFCALLDGLFTYAVSACKNAELLTKLSLIRLLLQGIYKEEFHSFRHTIHMWTPKVLLHGQQKIYPFLNKEDKELCKEFFF
jgi:hypothetical protein